METGRTAYAVGVSGKQANTASIKPAIGPTLMADAISASAEAIGRLADSVASARGHADRVFGGPPGLSGPDSTEPPPHSQAAQLMAQLRTIHDLISTLNGELARFEVL